MNTSFVKGTIALLLFSGAMTVGDGGGIQLKYAFENGKVYKYKTRIEFFNVAAKEGSGSPAKLSAEMSIGVGLSVNNSSSMTDQRWKFVVDTIGMQMVIPGGENRSMSFEQLKGKWVDLVMDNRGVARSIQANDPSTLNQTRELGFELFSKDLLNVTLMFPEYPKNSIETNQPWRYSRTDTTSRGGQQLVVTRSSEFKIVGTAPVGKQMCHKIAYTVVTRISGQSVKGETTATGVLYCSEEGIPIESEATVKVALSAGGIETFQNRTVKTVLE